MQKAMLKQRKEHFGFACCHSGLAHEDMTIFLLLLLLMMPMPQQQAPHILDNLVPKKLASTFLNIY
jgi:hypothetical protein